MLEEEESYGSTGRLDHCRIFGGMIEKEENCLLRGKLDQSKIYGPKEMGRTSGW